MQLFAPRLHHPPPRLQQQQQHLGGGQPLPAHSRLTSVELATTVSSMADRSVGGGDGGGGSDDDREGSLVQASISPRSSLAREHRSVSEVFGGEGSVVRDNMTHHRDTSIWAGLPPAVATTAAAVGGGFGEGGGGGGGASVGVGVGVAFGGGSAHNAEWGSGVTTGATDAAESAAAGAVSRAQHPAGRGNALRPANTKQPYVPLAGQEMAYNPGVGSKELAEQLHVPHAAVAGQTAHTTATGVMQHPAVAGQVPDNAATGVTPHLDVAGQVPGNAATGVMPHLDVAGQVPGNAATGVMQYPAVAGQVPGNAATGVSGLPTSVQVVLILPIPHLLYGFRPALPPCNMLEPSLLP